MGFVLYKRKNIQASFQNLKIQIHIWNDFPTFHLKCLALTDANLALGTFSHLFNTSVHALRPTACTGPKRWTGLSGTLTERRQRGCLCESVAGAHRSDWTSCKHWRTLHSSEQGPIKHHRASGVTGNCPHVRRSTEGEMDTVVALFQQDDVIGFGLDGNI